MNLPLQLIQFAAGLVILLDQLPVYLQQLLVVGLPLRLDQLRLDWLGIGFGPALFILGAARFCTACCWV
jgi:hypothetical protein